MTPWVQMLVTMADGPALPVHGTMVPYRNSDVPLHYYYGTYGEEPVFLPLRSEGVRLLRWGRRSRIESLDGTVLFVSDGETAWDFTTDPDRPRCTEVKNVHSPGSGRFLVITPRVSHWAGEHWARPTGPVSDVEFLGRPCWSVELGATENSDPPEPSLRLVVDAESGAVLGQHGGDGIDGAAFTEVTVGEPLDPSLFTWDGPVITDDESRIRAGRGTPDEPDREESLQWFRDTVTADPIRVPVTVDLSPHSVHWIDRDAGAFSAELGQGRYQGWLTRRPRSTEPWRVQTYSGQIAWSTSDFDWAIQTRRGALDAVAVDSLQQQLHPGEPVVGTPPLAFGGSDGP
ncbi:hypothetical protein [Prescottella sp. R16]|uniref:hypothetical protein n=1 Tax=Prescottella sp. R16 TaxID=3064529 RepID=UPI00272EDCA2|nr:hypothetical protein [Prescottella sp. R16]